MASDADMDTRPGPGAGQKIDPTKPGPDTAPGNPMCEKAARIAELESEIEWRESRSPVGTKHQQRNAFALAEARAELARFRNEQDSFSPTEEQCREAANARGEDYAAPVLTQGEGSEPVGLWRYKGENLWHECNEAEYHVLGSNPEDVERRLLYASPPPLSAGNADPRVREALGEALQSYTGARSLHNPTSNSSCERLEKAHDELLDAVRSVLALPSPQSQGPVEAAEWQPIEAAPKDGTWILTVARSAIPVVLQWNDRRQSWREPDEAPDAPGTFSAWTPRWWFPIMPWPDAPAAAQPPKATR